MAKDLQPLSVVESEAFRNLLHIAEPQYSMPTRKYLKKQVTNHYSTLYAHIKSQLMQCSQVCLTLDIWSSRQMRSYLGVTCHFIADFKLQSLMLACRRFMGSHTGDEIATHFEEIVESFDLTGKVFYVVTDNASNMTRAFHLLTSIDESDTEHDTDFDKEDEIRPVELGEQLDAINVPMHQPCFAHTVQLVVKDGLKQADQINRVLGKITKFVSHVRSSTKASDLLESEVRLQAANVTRWNSQLNMLKSLLKVSNDTMEKIDFNEKPNQHDLNVVRDLVEILTPFLWATDLTQGQNKVTASMILPVVRGLRNEINELHKKFKSRFVSTLKSSIDARLSKYEQECFKVAAALDPRWKLAWCTTLLEATDIKQLVIEKVTVLYNNSSLTTSVESTESPDSPPIPKRSKLFQFMTDTPIATTPIEGINVVISKVETYFDTPCLPEDSNPLVYWQSQHSQQPQLAEIACHYLSIPASSGPVERLFSVAGKVFRPDRCRLSDTLFEQLMFVRCNQDL